jgi:hypothetical protein
MATIIWTGLRGTGTASPPFSDWQYWAISWCSSSLWNKHNNSHKHCIATVCSACDGSCTHSGQHKSSAQNFQSSKPEVMYAHSQCHNSSHS